MNWEVVNDIDQAKIKVIGVGGAGGNAVIHMMNHKIQGVEFICANTDSQALENAKGATILKLGGGMTKGLGAGANEPTMGDFTEVSEVVEEFTADDATCIYGLVIDPSLKDELMVTIVATGVNQKSPKLAIDNKPRASIKLSPVGLDKDLTNKEVQQVGASSAEAIDFLDVPTFMRKQVD